MGKYICKPFGESIVEAVNPIQIMGAGDLEVLDALAVLTARTTVSRFHRFAVGAAFARKVPIIEQGPSFRRADAVLTNVRRVIEMMVEQDGSD